MMIPDRAPFTPASQEPEVSGVPSAAYATVSSPRYHTLPRVSCAYQSVVRSSTLPSCSATSVITVAVTPSITFVWSVTVTVSRRGWPSFRTRYTIVRPTGSGKYGLSMGAPATNIPGSNAGIPGASGGAEGAGGGTFGL